MEDIMNKEAQDILSRLIAIDTEYHCDSIGKIDKVYCLCATDAFGRTCKKWTVNYNGDILNELRAFYGIDNPIYVEHAFDKAERRALKFLGTDNSNYQFICTYHLAKMLQNSFCKSSARVKLKKMVFETDAEKIEEANKVKKAKVDSLSYAGLCHKYGLALIDTRHKEAMRKLCIDDTTEGYEQQIMDYCASDTQFLIPLFKQLFNEYFKALKGSFCPLRPGRFDNITPIDAVKCLVKQMQYVNEFGDIADYGIPLDLGRVEIIKKNAPAYREKLKSDFNAKYPGTFKVCKDNLLHEDVASLQKYLAENISKFGIKNYPRSDSGRLSMNDDILKEYFGHKECFGENYRQLNKLIRKLSGVSKQDDNPFNYIIDGKLWYESLQSYGTITSRCTPSTKRFIFGWHKSLYGLMNPKPGKWLVELDYGSEETFIQACICKDAAYNEIYNSKDIYLAFANKMRLVPDDDWNNLSKDELKEKYHNVRSSIKSLILGLSYGMGAKKLSQRLGIPLAKAEGYVEQVNRILHRSTLYKANLKTAITRCKAFSLPDGFICKGADRAVDNNATTIINFPFQSGGGSILRVLVHQLTKAIKEGALKAEIVATIHDAIFFEVDEGDHDTIQRVSDTMKDVADKVLNAPKGWTIKVGSPEIIKHGEIWTPEHSFDSQFEELLNFNQSEC